MKNLRDLKDIEGQDLKFGKFYEVANHYAHLILLIIFYRNKLQSKESEDTQKERVSSLLNYVY